MRAGKLRHRVIIEQVTSTDDGYGGRSDAWATFATVWASVKPLRGHEYFQAQQMQAKVTHKVKIRYLQGVTHKMRVKYGSRILNIVSVINPDEKSRELVLMCEEAAE